jgi:hypothetical protein
MISGFGATTSVIISIWVIAGFLLLPAGSLRYWTAAFVVLLVVVGFGDHLPVRALLAALLALHVVFVAPAASRSGQRPLLWMALVSLALLAALVITGGVRYWLPALIVAAVVVPFGVPLLWAKPRDRGPVVEVRWWSRRPGSHPPDQPAPAAPDPPDHSVPAAPQPTPDPPDQSVPAAPQPAPDPPDQSVPAAPEAASAPPEEVAETAQADEADEADGGAEKSPPPHNVRPVPRGKRPGARPAARNRPQR